MRQAGTGAGETTLSRDATTTVLMEHITRYRPEIRREGVHYHAFSFEEFYVGARLHWRVLYRNHEGEVIQREFVTGRILVNGELVIEGTRK